MGVFVLKDWRGKINKEGGCYEGDEDKKKKKGCES
jgi:hypothetical protein